MVQREDSDSTVGSVFKSRVGFETTEGGRERINSDRLGTGVAGTECAGEVVRGVRDEVVEVV